MYFFFQPLAASGAEVVEFAAPVKQSVSYDVLHTGAWFDGALRGKYTAHFPDGVRSFLGSVSLVYFLMIHGPGRLFCCCCKRLRKIIVFAL